MTIIKQYVNGNVNVTLYDDGTKVREWEGVQKVEFPESIDVKITDYCLMGCKFCYEMSTRKGKHGDLETLKTKLSSLPSGIELAIGGGNPLDHYGVVEFLTWCKDKGYVCNLTMNQGHIRKYGINDITKYAKMLRTLIDDKLIYGLGISVNTIGDANLVYNENTIFHVIAGVHDIGIIDTIKSKYENPKILVLGYKNVGFGITYFNKEVNDNVWNWKMHIPKYFGNTNVAFDNLAVKQLEIKKWFTNDEWAKYYMGDDGTTSMYIDAVKGQYAVSSSSSIRTSWEKMDVKHYFQEMQNAK